MFNNLRLLTILFSLFAGKPFLCWELVYNYSKYLFKGTLFSFYYYLSKLSILSSLLAFTFVFLYNTLQSERIFCLFDTKEF